MLCSCSLILDLFFLRSEMMCFCMLLNVVIHAISAEIVVSVKHMWNSLYVVFSRVLFVL